MVWSWIPGNLGLIGQLTRQNAYIGIVSAVTGLIIAVPLGIASARWRWLYPPVLSAANVIYALPSLALFVALIDYTGLSDTTVIIPLTLFSLVVILPNVVVFKGFDALDESGPITLKALMDGQVQAADVFTTTPQILTDHLVSLADPKSNFAAQNVIPLVYRKGVNATIVNTLNAISARLTTAGLLEMDKAIVVDHANYSTVATAWLKAEGLPS
jgi:ABC-type phosphate/phosphonate transport system permease subunit